MIHNGTLNDHKKVCNSCTIYIVLLVILAVFSFIFIGTQKEDTLKWQFIKHVNGNHQTN